MKRVETILESVMLRSRWLRAPLFFGLVFAILVLLVKFAKLLAALVAPRSFLSTRRARNGWAGA
jgi:uncharacterized membrane protein YqhA